MESNQTQSYLLLFNNRQLSLDSGGNPSSRTISLSLKSMQSNWFSVAPRFSITGILLPGNQPTQSCPLNFPPRRILNTSKPINHSIKIYNTLQEPGTIPLRSISRSSTALRYCRLSRIRSAVNRMIDLSESNPVQPSSARPSPGQPSSVECGSVKEEKGRE